MAITSPVTTLLQIFDSAGKSLFNETDADMQTWTTTFTVKYRVDIAITTTPVSYAVNNVIGASPVYLYIFNPNTVNITVAGSSIVGITLAAGTGMLIPTFDTTGQLTLSAASGTGNIAKVMLLD